MDILKLMLLFESSQREKYGAPRTWAHTPVLQWASHCRELSGRSAMLSQLPLQRKNQLRSLLSLVSRENRTMPRCHWTALRLCSIQKASDASVLFVREPRKIIYVHKQRYRTSVTITSNTLKLAVPGHVISTDFERQRGAGLLKDLLSYLPSFLPNRAYHFPHHFSPGRKESPNWPKTRLTGRACAPLTAGGRQQLGREPAVVPTSLSLQMFWIITEVNLLALPQRDSSDGRTREKDIT